MKPTAKQQKIIWNGFEIFEYEYVQNGQVVLVNKDAMSDFIKHAAKNSIFSEEFLARFEREVAKAYKDKGANG